MRFLNYVPRAAAAPTPGTTPSPLRTVCCLCSNSTNCDGTCHLDVGGEEAQNFLNSDRRGLSVVIYGIDRDMVARPLLTDEDREAFLNRVEKEVRSTIQSTMRATDDAVDGHQR